MTASEALANIYADFFAERIRTLSSLPSGQAEPLIIDCPYPHQNISGNAYRGINRCLVPFVASQYGYRIPVWLTFNQKNDLGLSLNKGSKSVPVVYTSVTIIDTLKGTPSTVTEQEYDAMTPTERSDNHLTKRFATKWYRVFNLEETDFAQVYPLSMDALRERFSLDERHSEVSLLDEMVSSGSWLCPVDVVSGQRARYDKDSDRIIISPKGDYLSDGAYYGELLRAMAASTGSEMRNDRDIWSSLASDSVREDIVCELCAASMGALLGISIAPSERTINRLEGWLKVIDEDKSFIYDAISEAARATDTLHSALNLKPVQTVDVQEVVGRLEAEVFNKKKEESSKQRTAGGPVVEKAEKRQVASARHPKPKTKTKR